MVALVDNLSDHQDEPPERLVENAITPLEPAVQIAADRLLCLGGQGTLDDATSAILAQLLQRRGVGAWATSLVELPQQGAAQSDSKGIRLDLPLLFGRALDYPGKVIL